MFYQKLRYHGDSRKHFAAGVLVASLVMQLNLIEAVMLFDNICVLIFTQSSCYGTGSGRS